jgi:hypothetical protein
MTSLLRRFSPIALAASLVAVCVVACSGESEGQRCELTDDPGGDNDGPGGSDCASGLECYSAGELGGIALSYASTQNDPSFGICCPDDRANATTSICALFTSVSGDAAPPPATDAASDGPSETGTADASAPDVGTDSPIDSATDSAEDAPGDSPSDSAFDSAG